MTVPFAHLTAASMGLSYVRSQDPEPKNLEKGDDFKGVVTAGITLLLLLTLKRVLGYTVTWLS